MTLILTLRALTAVLFLIAFFGMAKDWERRIKHLTVVGRRQYFTYYLFMLVGLTAAMSGIWDKSPASWMDWARLVLALAAAVTSNWRLHEEYRAEGQ